MSVLDAAPPFLLLIPGFLPCLYFAHSRLIVSPSPAKPAPVICIFVSLLGPLAALSASLGIAAVPSKDQSQSLHVAQNIIQSFVEFGYRISILYLITPRSFAVLASRISLSQREIFRHNALFASIILATFLLSAIQAAIASTLIPTAVPLTFAILAALFPVPLAVHLAFSAQSIRVRRMWEFITLLQGFSALAATLRIPQGVGYELSSALFTVLWGGGVITLFYTLSSAPLPAPASQPLRLPGFALLPSTPSTPVRVHYEAPHVRQFSSALISEDFTALRDPFASPPPVSPLAPRFPSPIPTTTTPRIVLSPPPTPLRKPARPPKPKAREIKPPRRKKSARESAQSLIQPASASEDGRRASDGSEDALFLSDEALLSQILLHSLIMEATPAPAPPPPPSLLSPSIGRGAGSSICSDFDSMSVTTIRTRRDENGRRYASEEVRYSDLEPAGVEDSAVMMPPEDVCLVEEGKVEAQVVVAAREGPEQEQDPLCLPLKEGGVQVGAAWWVPVSANT